jgi:hypothetical protein
VDVSTRLARWKESRNYVAIGNAGEHITARLLISLGYQLLGAQDDYLGMVSEALGIDTRANPEDFLAIDPTERFMTVNSKATISPRACRITRSGNLSTPRLAKGQNDRHYSTLRANLASPIAGDSFAQVVKVDLLNMKAQVFEIADDATLLAIDRPYDIALIVDEVMAAYPHHMPPPNVWEMT